MKEPRRYAPRSKLWIWLLLAVFLIIVFLAITENDEGPTEEVDLGTEEPMP